MTSGNESFAYRTLARVIRPFQLFIEAGSIGGVILLIAAVVALVWANSPWAESYFHLWETQLAVGPSANPLVLSLHEWINDALMAVFFLLVGLEIKRELLVGELAEPRQAALPIMGALGGMIVPALIYTAFNFGGPGAHGWGIPMATDIAFAIGVMALLGPRVPVGLKVFLTALAIVDDMGAVIVIALFYTASLDTMALLLAALALVGLIGLNFMRVSKLLPYLVFGAMLWYFTLMSGIHATIAGVLLALTIPASTRRGSREFSGQVREMLDSFDHAESAGLFVITNKKQQEVLHLMDQAVSDVNAPLMRLEHVLNRPVAFLIVPLFALSNAGVRPGSLGSALATPVAIGVILGLVFGKTIGISLFSWLAVRLRLAALPHGTGWAGLVGTAIVGGIGFTMSLFIAGLAFADPALLDDAKIGILAGSTIAGIVGFVILRRLFGERGAESPRN